ncbi:MAG: hypothetical protein IKP06_04625 [Elusimicrobiaceae bacterium]|nr:hypothetical protein [Elusimicrobiaceae bacterium]
MKKFLILFFMFCALPALAETISAVSFNPMRVGSFFESLKVSKGAIFRGGLYVWNEPGSKCEGVPDGMLEVRGTSVKMNNLTDPKEYRIEKVDTLPQFLTLFENSNPAVQPETKVSFERMPFRSSGGPDTSQVDFSNPLSWPSIGTQVTVHGGRATFIGDPGTYKNSYVKELDFPAFDIGTSTVDCYTQLTGAGNVVAKNYADCANRMMVYAKNFQMPNMSNRRLQILGSDVIYDKGRIRLMTSGFGVGSYTRGLRLGGIDIQKPRRHVEGYYNGNVEKPNGAFGGMMPPDNLAGCCLKWSYNQEVVGASQKVSVLYLECGGHC